MAGDLTVKQSIGIEIDQERFKADVIEKELKEMSKRQMVTGRSYRNA